MGEFRKISLLTCSHPANLRNIIFWPGMPCRNREAIACSRADRGRWDPIACVGAGTGTEHPSAERRGGKCSVTAKPRYWITGGKTKQAPFCSSTWLPSTPRILPWKGGRGGADIWSAFWQLLLGADGDPHPFTCVMSPGPAAPRNRRGFIHPEWPKHVLRRQGFKCSFEHDFKCSCL